MRHVICHYHIYKNSGTTFDHLLARNFGDRHVCFDGPFPYFTIGQKELAKQNYAKASQIDPKNEDARRNLQRLGGG